MDLLESLLEDTTISEYLRQYPEHHWVDIIKKTLVYGIQSLSALELSGIHLKPTLLVHPNKLANQSSAKQCQHPARKKKRRKSCFNMQTATGRLKKTSRGELQQASPNSSHITRGSSQTHCQAEISAPMKAFYQQQFKFLLPEAVPFSASLAD